MTKPLTIEQIAAAFDIVAERVKPPRQVCKIERLMTNEILLTFTNGHCLCIDDSDVKEYLRTETSSADRLG